MMPNRGGPERTWKRVRTSWSASVCREDSISQMGVVHLWALKIIARGGEEATQLCLSFSCILLLFFLPESFLPFSDRYLKMRAFTLGQWWHRDRKPTGPKVVARLKISLCMQLPDVCLLLPMPSLPCAMVAEQGWGDELWLLCWQHG